MYVFNQLQGLGAPNTRIHDVIVRRAENPAGDVQVIQRDPPPTASPGRSTQVHCDTVWLQLLRAAPMNIRACLVGNPMHKLYYNNLCARLVAGSTAVAAGEREWADYVTRNCTPRTNTPATPRTPTRVRQPSTPTRSNQHNPPSSTPTTPGGDVNVPPPGGDNDSGFPGGGDPGADDETKHGFLRQVGGVVGIGLFVAVGLTVARDKKFMRKLTKGRRRR